MKINISEIDFTKLNGLVAVVVQDWITKNVLMVGFMNEEALRKTIAEKKVTFWSRTKNRLWQKGETSGNFLHVKDIVMDCDKDSLLINAEPIGATCHTGTISCFGDEPIDITFLEELYQVIQSRKNSSITSSYTASLFQKGIDAIAQKVGEEAVETILASKNEDKQRFIEETSDLLYHLLVLLSHKNVSTKEIMIELKKRHKK